MTNVYAPVGCLRHAFACTVCRPRRKSDQDESFFFRSKIRIPQHTTLYEIIHISYYTVRDVRLTTGPLFADSGRRLISRGSTRARADQRPSRKISRRAVREDTNELTLKYNPRGAGRCIVIERLREYDARANNVVLSDGRRPTVVCGMRVRDKPRA